MADPVVTVRPGTLADVSRDIVRAQKLALRDAKGRAGAFEVNYVALDSSDPETGRAEVARQRYLTAPAVRPAWICRWKIAYTTIIGRIERVSAANNVDHAAW